MYTVSPGLYIKETNCNKHVFSSFHCKSADALCCAVSETGMVIILLQVLHKLPLVWHWRTEASERMKGIIFLSQAETGWVFRHEKLAWNPFTLSHPSQINRAHSVVCGRELCRPGSAVNQNEAAELQTCAPSNFSPMCLHVAFQDEIVSSNLERATSGPKRKQPWG